MNWKSVVIGLALGLVWNDVEVTASVCVNPFQVKRQGRTSCWASFRVSVESTACIPKALWLKILDQPRLNSLCPLGFGKWKNSVPTLFRPGQDKRSMQRLIYKVRSLPKNRLPSSRAYQVAIRWEKWRESISAKLSVSDPWGWVRRLLLFESSPDSPEPLLRILGFVHLVSPAGIHLYALQRHLRWLISVTMAPFFLTVSVVRLSNGLSHLSWIFLWLAQGGRLGMLRPWLIVGLWDGARFFGFRWRRWSPFLVAMAVNLGWWIWTWLQNGRVPPTGEIHYALAVAGSYIALSTQSFRLSSGLRNELQLHVRLSVGSWLPTAIWDAASVGGVSIATPVISLLTVPFLTLLFFPLSWMFLLAGVDSSLAFLVETSQWILERLAQGVLRFPLLWVIDRVRFVPALVGFSVVLFLWNARRRWIALSVGILIVVLLRLSPTRENLVQLDVGQGDAALIVGPGQTALVDVGSAQNMTEAKWLKTLMYWNVPALNVVTATHMDEDHWGGVWPLSRVVPIDCIDLHPTHWASWEGASKFWLKRGNCLPRRLLRVFVQDRKAKRNHQMSAFIYEAAGWSWINLGDASHRLERQLDLRLGLADYCQGRRCILKISHHGSHHSSGLAFLRGLSPAESWISVGASNLHGHPSVRVLDYLEQTEIPVKRTDHDGPLVVKGESFFAFGSLKKLFNKLFKNSDLKSAH